MAFGLFWAGAVQAQVGASISADGTAPNANAMLDVQSPATGAGKGLLTPRVTMAQRTTASSILAGGLLDSSGNLRGGAAQGLIVYQTDGVQGLYFNTSQTAAPTWAYLGDITGLLASNDWTLADSTTNYLPRTGGTMSGALNMDAQIITNVSQVDFNGTAVSVGRGANGSSSGAAVGYAAVGANFGTALGPSANGSDNGAAVGYSANGYFAGVAVGLLAIGTNYGVAMGYQANGNDYGVAVGRNANGTDYGAAVGRSANGSSVGAAMGYQANGNNSGAALGRQANGSAFGVAVGNSANGSSEGVALGDTANGADYGAAVGFVANGSSYGAGVGWRANSASSGAAVGRDANGLYLGTAVGRSATGRWYGAVIGYLANGISNGVAVGYSANGPDYGVAMGYSANGAQTNVAIGAYATALGGSERIAIGHYVTNNVDNSAVIRGTLYLDGGTGVVARTNFGGAWFAKAFEIDHPLDPANKVLRHFCLEGPQVWNVYAGNAQLVNGQAVVQLPDYYSALNLVGLEIYSLTPVGGWAPIWVDAKVSDSVFVIAGQADLEVSWTIKVLRNDPGCLEDLRHRPVEQLKSEWQKWQMEAENNSVNTAK